MAKVQLYCTYCHRPCDLVRQVPAPVPVSDCYCDECVDACREDYMATFNRKPSVFDRLRAVKEPEYEFRKVGDKYMAFKVKAGEEMISTESA